MQNNCWHAENRGSQKKCTPSLARPGVWVGRRPPECGQWTTPCNPRHPVGPSAPAAARFAAGTNRSPPMFRPRVVFADSDFGACGGARRAGRACRVRDAGCAPGRGLGGWNRQTILLARGTRCFAAVSGALERIFDFDAEGVQNLAVRAGRGAAGEDRRECQLSVLQLVR